jgi:hypothetical protein
VAGVGVDPPEPVTVAPRLCRIDRPSAAASPTSVDWVSSTMWMTTMASDGAVYSKKSCWAVTATDVKLTE